MIRTEVAYAGGSKVNPTYHDLGDHTEALRIEYDTNWLSLDELLDMFWKSHDPRFAGRSTQYRAALFCEDEEQAAAARASAEREGARSGYEIKTAIEVARPYYPAEAYHQKWSLRRNTDLFDDLRKNYVNEQALLRSTAAAKLNGYLGGHGSAHQLERDINRFGLSGEGRERLAAAWRRRGAA